MSISRVKTWVKEVLTFSDLNDEFNNILNNPIDLWTPAAKAVDFNAQELILDDDQDTSITADTDDQIDFKVGGSDVMILTSTDLTINGRSLVSGTRIAEAAYARSSDLETRVNALRSPSGQQHDFGIYD